MEDCVEPLMRTLPTSNTMLTIVTLKDVGLNTRLGLAGIEKHIGNLAGIEENIGILAGIE